MTNKQSLFIALVKAEHDMIENMAFQLKRCAYGNFVTLSSHSFPASSPQEID